MSAWFWVAFGEFLLGIVLLDAYCRVCVAWRREHDLRVALESLMDALKEQTRLKLEMQALHQSTAVDDIPWKVEWWATSKATGKDIPS